MSKSGPYSVKAVRLAQVLKPRRDWRDRLAGLGLSAEDHERLLRALELAGPHHGMRAAFVSAIEPFLEQLRPEVLPRFRGLVRGTRSYGPFAWAPYRHLVPTLAAAASACAPGRPIQPRLDVSILRLGRAIHELPVFAPLVRASEGDLGAFIEAIAQGSSLLFNHGSIKCHRHGREALALRFEEHVTDCLRLFAVGYFRGVLTAFDHPQHEVEFVALSDSACVVTLRW